MPKQNTPFLLKVLRKVFPFLENAIPPLARRVAYRSFFFPMDYPFPTYELPYLEKAITEAEHFDGVNIKIYQWGNIESDKKVLLVHGWAGRATQFRIVIDTLMEQGFHIISYDAPGHGKSEGKTSNLPEMARIISMLQSRFKFSNLIGHSMGGGACIFSIIKEGVKIDRLILVSAPTSAEVMLDDFLLKINGGHATKEYLKQHILKIFDKPLSYYFADQLLPHKDFPKTLAVHDETDYEVRFDHLTVLKERISDLEIVKTQDLGHTKVLRNEEVLRRIVSFL